MNNKYINIYNSFVILTRNKTLYEGFIKQDTFSDRMIFFLFHFSFLLKVYKNECSKKTMQDVFDYIFKQLELNIREIGYGDVSVNKNMKNYINLFYNILETAEKWEKLNKNDQQKVFLKYLNLSTNNEKITNYFENYLNYLKNNTFNSLLKGVIKLNF
jgi:cytochrome b pre-mRNA-processing protein 3